MRTWITWSCLSGLLVLSGCASPAWSEAARQWQRAQCREMKDVDLQRRCLEASQAKP